MLVPFHIAGRIPDNGELGAGQSRKKKMKKKLIWRLSSLPTVEDLKTAVEAGLLTKEDAKDMLVRSEEEIPTDQLKEVKDELKLLRDLVMKIASDKPTVFYPFIVERIKTVPHYYDVTWTTPWVTYCNSAGYSTGNDFKITS